MSTFEQVQKIISETLNCDLEAVTETASLIDDLNADSLDAVELSMEIEEAFDIVIEDEDLSNFKTAGDIVKFIDARQSK